MYVHIKNTNNAVSFTSTLDRVPTSVMNLQVISANTTHIISKFSYYNESYYSSPSIERPLPQKTTSSYRPLLPCTDALTVHTIKPPLEDHLFSETKFRWI